MQNKAHGQNINFLLVNSASRDRECIGIMLGQAILNSQYTEFYVFIFCVKLEIVGSLKLISHPGHSILGGGWRGARNTIHANIIKGRFRPKFEVYVIIFSLRRAGTRM